MKDTQMLVLAAAAVLVLSGCGESRESVQPGSPQWAASQDTSQADVRDGKDVTLSVPKEMIHPGVGGEPPPNVKIVPKSDK